MTRDEAFPGIYLRKGDLPEPVTATIVSVKNDKVFTKRGPATKPVMRFKGDALKPFVLTPTNWDRIAAAYGKDSDAWIGKAIEIYVDKNVSFGGSAIGGIRVRIPAPKAGNAPSQAAPSTPPLAERVAKAVKVFDGATAADVLEGWIQQALNLPGLTAEHRQQIETSAERNRARLTRPLPAPPQARTSASSPAPARR